MGIIKNYDKLIKDQEKKLKTTKVKDKEVKELIDSLKKQRDQLSQKIEKKFDPGKSEQEQGIISTLMPLGDLISCVCSKCGKQFIIKTPKRIFDSSSRTWFFGEKCPKCGLVNKLLFEK